MAVSNTTQNFTRESFEYRIGRNINSYYPPIIIVFGTVGNALSFIVYGRYKQREKPLSVFMRALAIADTSMLFLLFNDWLNRFLNLRSESRCIGTAYIQHFVFNCCEYILVAITFSRLIAVVFPLRAIKSTLQAKLCIASIVIASCLVNLYMIWTTQYAKRRSRSGRIIYTCMMGIHAGKKIVFFMWFYTTVSYLLPMMLVFIPNLYIVYELNRKKKSKQIRVQRVSRIEMQRKREVKVTMMLVIMTFVFLMLLFPLFVTHMYRTFVLNSRDDADTKAKSFLAWNICEKLYYTNNAVNFYIYALFGTEFRKELRKLFIKKNRVAPSVGPSVEPCGTQDKKQCTDSSQYDASSAV